MSPKKRDPKNRDLPDNLYDDGKYWKYDNKFAPKSPIRMPKRDFTREEAKQAARKLNEKYAPDSYLQIAEKIESKSSSDRIKKLIEDFIDEYVPLMEWSSGTESNYLYALNRYCEHFKNCPLRNVTLEMYNKYLGQYPASAYNNHNKALNHFYKFAISKGAIKLDQNWPMIVLKRKEKKIRRDLSMEHFNILYKAAPEFMQIAMDTALVLLQGRHEVVSIKLDDYDKDTNKLRIIRKKTQKFGKAAYLEITPGESFREIWTRSSTSMVASPFLVHRLMKSHHAGHRKGKEHHTQVLPGFISKAFNDMAKITGVFKDWPQEEWPTFHEIRGLGGRIYKDTLMENGYTEDDAEKYVQALMAHTTIKTTRIYIGGRTEEWSVCEAGMDLKQVKKIL